MLSLHTKVINEHICMTVSLVLERHRKWT